VSKLAFALGISLAVATAANAVPIVANNSFETFTGTIGADVDSGPNAGFGYTPGFGGANISVTSWTFSPSGGGGSSGKYAGIVRESTSSGAATGGLQTPSPYPDGSYAAFVEVLGWMSQSISSFDAGQSYTVSFYAAGRNYSFNSINYGPQVLKVELDSTTLTFSANSTVTPSLGSWTLYTSDPFTTTAGAHTLKFTGVTGQDLTSAIDLVNINAVPEPSSLALLLLGMVGLHRFSTWRRSGCTAG
jgi:hypothetical protein